MRQRYPAGVVTLSSLLAMVACFVLRVFISDVSTRLRDIQWLKYSFDLPESAYAFAPSSEALSSSPVPSAESPAAVLDQLRLQEQNIQTIPSQKAAAKDYPDIIWIARGYQLHMSMSKGADHEATSADETAGEGRHPMPDNLPKLRPLSKFMYTHFWRLFMLLCLFEFVVIYHRLWEPMIPLNDDGSVRVAASQLIVVCCFCVLLLGSSDVLSGLLQMSLFLWFVSIPVTDRWFGVHDNSDTESDT